jgi:hypothetical protein
MMKLIRSEDLKSLFTGAAFVAVAGLAAGGLMYPDLRGPTEAEGPQLHAGVSGPRSAYQGGMTATWASYDGKVPDYVIGTQWLQPPQYEVHEDEAGEIPPSDETVVYAAEPADTGHAVPAAWEEPPREPVSFPSTSGGVPYGADLPRPPPPPAHDDPEIADLHAANPG